MAQKILAKDKLDAFLQGLSRDQDLFAPAMRDGKVVWARVEKAEQALWDFSNTEMSPKDFLLPSNRVHDAFQERRGRPRGHDHARRSPRSLSRGCSLTSAPATPRPSRSWT